MSLFLFFAQMKWCETRPVIANIFVEPVKKKKKNTDEKSRCFEVLGLGQGQEFECSGCKRCLTDVLSGVSVCLYSSCWKQKQLKRHLSLSFNSAWPFFSAMPHLLLLTPVWINHSSDTGRGKYDHFLFPAPLGLLWNVCVQEWEAAVRFGLSKQNMFFFFFFRVNNKTKKEKINI